VAGNIAGWAARAGQGLAVEDVGVERASTAFTGGRRDWACSSLERGVQGRGFEQQGELFGEGDPVGHLDALPPAGEGGLRGWRRWGGVPPEGPSSMAIGLLQQHHPGDLLQRGVAGQHTVEAVVEEARRGAARTWSLRAS
jgi:hypothetical protein